MKSVLPIPHISDMPTSIPMMPVDPMHWTQDYPVGFPIAVDLDGTLFPYHVMWRPFPALSTMLEQGLQSIRQPHPWAWLKHSLTASSWSPPSKPWPLHQPVVDLLNLWKESGCQLVLCTGAPQTVAETIAHGIGMFDHVLSSTATHHLVGKHKATALIKNFGLRGFTYIGDSWQDPPVWRHSRDIIAVTSPQSHLARWLNLWTAPPQRLAILPHPLSPSQV